MEATQPDDANKTLMVKKDSILQDHNVHFLEWLRLGMAPVHIYKQESTGHWWFTRERGRMRPAVLVRLDL